MFVEVRVFVAGTSMPAPMPTLYTTWVSSEKLSENRESVALLGSQFAPVEMVGGCVTLILLGGGGVSHIFVKGSVYV